MARSNTIETRRNLIRQLAREYCGDFKFEQFVQDIFDPNKGIGVSVALFLWHRGFRNKEAIREATDKELLRTYSVGHKKLNQLRKICG